MHISLPSTLFFGLTLHLASAPPVLASNAAECLRNYRSRFTQSLLTFDIRAISAWSGGGGPIEHIPDEQGFQSSIGHPFRTRSYGGADRKSIFGTRSYGSGYIYDNGDTSTIGNRGFPHGTYPIYWADNYLGGAEYSGDAVEVVRPGGRLVQVDVASSTDRWGDLDPATEVYTLVGDRDSVTSIMASMVDWCRADQAWPVLFRPAVAGSPRNDSDTQIRPENVIQYYRSSSFALAFRGYNNSFAVNPTAVDVSEYTELGTRQRDSQFLKCINETIGNAVPILDQPPAPPMSPGVLAAIVLSCVFGPLILGMLCGCWR